MTIITTLNANRPDVAPSLNLDFANKKQLDPRMNYTRSGIGTYYDGKTTVKAEENLITNSVSIGGGGWNNTGYNITQNATTAPDGTNTAALVSPTAAGAGTSVAMGTGVGKTTEAYTWSIYAKQESTDYTHISLYWNSSGSANVMFDIVNGTVGPIASGNGLMKASIQAVGNGWFRCSITYSQATSTAATFYVLDGTDFNLNNGPDGVKGMYVWGAQLEKRGFLTTYTPTSGSLQRKNQSKLIVAEINEPRFDHDPVTGESLGLLIEQNSENLYNQNSNLFSGTTGNTVRARDAVAPDGTVSGITITPTAGTGGSGYAYDGYSNVVGAGTFTISAYVKWIYGTGHILFGLGSGGSGNLYLQVNYNLTTSGAVSGNMVVNSTTLQDVGNGWYRVSVTGTTPDGSGYAEFQAFPRADTQYAIWGVQVEQRPFMTSYIPTGTSTVSRGEDGVSFPGALLSEWYGETSGSGSNGGTFYFEWKKSGIIGSNDWGVLWRNPDNGARLGMYEQSNGAVYVDVSPSATEASLACGTTGSDFNKLACGFKHNDIAACMNGGILQTDTGARIPEDLYTFYLGWYSPGNSLHCHVKKFAYYPKRLTNNQIQALTED